MDAEGLKSLGWIVLWGAVFFLMMRFGCGAHIGGHHGHGRGGDGSRGKDDTASVKDPVCGMSVDPENAGAAAVHGGQTYYFCSANCREKFEKNPQSYLAGQPAGGHHHG